MEQVTDRRQAWTFLTNHARVLALIARDPDTRLRDIAATCNLTERAVQAIVTDLESAGYLTRERVGRRNRYQIPERTHLRHPAEAGLLVSDLLALLAADQPAADGGSSTDGRASGAADASPDGGRAVDGHS